MYQQKWHMAALGLAAMLAFLGCGGDENSPPDPDEPVQVRPQPTCTVKADCPNQSDDGGVRGDAQVPPPVPCIDIDGRACNGRGMPACIWYLVDQEACSYVCIDDLNQEADDAQGPENVRAYAKACGLIP